LTLDEAHRLLRDGFSRELPGVPGQRLLAPRPRIGWQPGRVPEDARAGAGLLLVYPRNDTAHVALTLRDDGLPHHAGQVSLPGGAVEAGETLIETALRETQEEIGVDAGQVEVLGALSPLHIPVSGFVLYPWVGLVTRSPVLAPEAREVARILEVDLECLRDPGVLGVETRRR